MDRVETVQGAPGKMTAGIEADVAYDVPPDAWYFAADRQERMPFADLTNFSANPAVQDFGNLLTVRDMCRYVESKVGAA